MILTLAFYLFCVIFSLFIFAPSIIHSWVYNFIIFINVCSHVTTPPVKIQISPIPSQKSLLLLNPTYQLQPLATTDLLWQNSMSWIPII